MAPGAMKVATLKKDHNPDAGTIIDGITFIIEYQWFRHQGTNLVDFCRLKRFVFCPFYDLLLQIGIHVVEIIAITGHPDKQIFVIFGAGLRRKQGS